MIEFLKYLKGYVKIKVWGFSPERFMNLCSNKNILLWDIRKEGDIYYMSISLQGFYKLRPIVKKTKTRVAILKRCGLPFLIPRVFARKIFVLGLFAAIAFWIWSSTYIWDISLSGNYTITEDIFEDFLDSQNIKIGMKRKDVDIANLEKEIRRTFNIVTWTSAKQEGTKLNIVIKENENIIVEKEEDNFPYGTNLISEYDGTIYSMIVRAGMPQVTIGQAIKMGDVLVSGSVPVFNEDMTVRKYQYASADADIYLKHMIPVKETLPFLYQEKIYTGREKKKNIIQIGEKEYKLSLEEISYLYYDVVINKNSIELLKGVSLPIVFGSKTYREYQNLEKSYTLNEAETILKEKYAKIITSLEEKGVQIIEKNVKIDTSSNEWILEGELQVVEKIGMTTENRLDDAEATQLEENEAGNE